MQLAEPRHFLLKCLWKVSCLGDIDLSTIILFNLGQFVNYGFHFIDTEIQKDIKTIYWTIDDMKIRDSTDKYFMNKQIF